MTARFRRTWAAAAGLAGLGCRDCLGHGTPIIVDQVGGQLTTDQPLYFQLDAELGFSPLDAPSSTIAPGYEVRGAHGLVSTNLITFNVDSRLWFSDGGAATPASSESLEVVSTFSTQGVVVTGQSPAHQAGGLLRAEGTFLNQHAHYLSYELTPNNQLTGAYGVLLELTTPGYQPSDPFLIVFNRGLDAADPVNGPLARAVSSLRAATLEPPAATVVARKLFYNNSNFDGDAAASAADDLAVATDKSALLPGNSANLSHYGSYARGINGIMIDVANLPATATLDAADFQFRAGNNNSPSAWSAAPAPSEISVRRGAGQGGSDRVTLVWPDGAIKKTWLQVSLLPTDDTGLEAADVFYFGNAIGETGNSTANAVVNAGDEIAARVNSRNPLNPAPITFAYDFNRDKLVNAADQILARVNSTNPLTSLALISPPGESALSGPAGLVPEPSGLPLAVLACGAATIWHRRRRRALRRR